jgi:NAD(P)-dependent dehydrogenase (short-subunit alcohol dehydrogenase family)
MTKAFLPILKRQAISGEHKRSQIVNMISVAGMTSGGGLAASAYEGSKHAAEAFTNALRLELKMFGIHVVALNPCFFDTPLTNGVQERFREQLRKKLSPELKEEYGEGMLRFSSTTTTTFSARYEILTIASNGFYYYYVHNQNSLTIMWYIAIG